MIFERLYKKITKNSSVLLKNATYSLFFKIIGFIISYVAIRISLDFVDNSVYGIWLTISSLISWFYLFDIGVTNGIKNRITSLYDEKKYKEIGDLLGNAYGIVSIVFLIVAIVFGCLSVLINWNKILNVNSSFFSLKAVIVITVIATCLRFILNIIGSVLQAINKSSYFDFLQLIAQIVSILPIFLIAHYRKGSLFEIAFYSSVIPVVVLFFFTLFFYLKREIRIKPDFSKFNFRDSKKLLATSGTFFFLQISVVLLMASDNILIANFFSPNEVTTYNLCYRYFWIIVTINGVILNPYWSLVTIAYKKKDRQWLRKSFFFFTILILAFACIIFAQYQLRNLIFTFWLGNKVVIPSLLSILMGIYMILLCWNGIVTFFLYGVEKIKLLAYTYFGILLFNIPISILFIKYFYLGVAGILYANIICLIFSVLLLTVQVMKIINFSDKGIWSK